MLHVVAKCRDQESKHVSVVKARILHQVLVRQYETAMLSDITAVQVIMVLDTSLVLVVDLHDELQKLVIVYNLM